MIDYASLLQGLRGPIQPVTLTPGFRAPPLPGPLGFAPRQQEQMGIPSIPGMGMGKKPGVQPSTSGAVMGPKESDGYSNAAAAIAAIPQNAQGGYDQPPMPTDIGYGQGGGGGSFSDWWKRNFGTLFQDSSPAPRRGSFGNPS